MAHERATMDERRVIRFLVREDNRRERGRFSIDSFGRAYIRDVSLAFYSVPSYVSIYIYIRRFVSFACILVREISR